ncbi:MAG: hypothetical protein ACRDZR_06550 [Acidimicrobiales bacterium]
MSRRVWVAVAAAVIVAVAIVAFVAYGGLGHGGTPRQQLAAWTGDTGLGQDLGALHHDSLNVERVLADHRGTGAVHTVCGVLSVTAQAAHDSLPSPDTRTTQLLARAYTLYYEAANDCYTAGATGTRLLRRSARERAAAAHDVSLALARIHEVAGVSVATTTTTQPTAGTGLFG